MDNIKQNLLMVNGYIKNNVFELIEKAFSDRGISTDEIHVYKFKVDDDIMVHIISDGEIIHTEYWMERIMTNILVNQVKRLGFDPDKDDPSEFNIMKNHKDKEFLFYDEPIEFNVGSYEYSYLGFIRGYKKDSNEPFMG